MMRGEYYVLALTALLGIFVLVSANSLLTVYIGVELLSLSLYAMVAFDRENGVAAEVGDEVLRARRHRLGNAAVRHVADLRHDRHARCSTISPRWPRVSPASASILGLVFLVVAVAFKFGAVPFHMWVPDVYTGAPTGVTLFLSTVPKIASFALAFRLLAHGMGSVGATWQDMLAPLAVLSMVFGNVVAIAQSNLKRMLAYSAIGNVGFILLGFVAGIRSRIRSRAVLHHRLRDHDARLVRRARARQPRRASKPKTSITSRACTSAIRCWRWS